MKYDSLRKLYYKNKQMYEQIYKERFSNGIHLGIEINNNQAFFVDDAELYKIISNIYKINGELIYLTNFLPNVAKTHYKNKCLIDEIVLTNDIEGVLSTRRELGEILSDLEKKDKRNRFYGLIKEYFALESNEELNLTDCQSIRDLYDVLFLDEVRSEDPGDIPDGAIFRAGPVSVIKATQQQIHRGLEPEEKIIEYMEKSLQLLSDETIDIFIRTSIFHYLFGYIHPFYEANGRMSRFISSYIISKNLVYLTGYHLSYYIKEHISEYYRAFEECNDIKNKGDITPFIHMFLSVILGSCTQLRDELRLLTNELDEYAAIIPHLYKNGKMRDLMFYLIQASLFSEIGISIEELLELTGVTRSTLKKRLDEVERNKLLIINNRKVKKYYMANLEKLAKYQDAEAGYELGKNL